MDFIGCALGGARMMAGRNEAFLRAVERQGGESSVIGTGRKTTLSHAAFLNAMNAHATELDDGHRLGMIHLGGSVLAALLAVAELEGLDEEAVLCGTVVGYEAAVRVAMSMQPSHKVRGYHTSGTCGTVGAAMAIAAALRFTRAEMKAALSAAAAGAAGLLEMQEDDSELKPYNLAHAAVSGITAAYAAKAGYTGPADPLGGRRGMLAVMSENPDTAPLTQEGEGRYEIERIYRKPYAACRHCHPAIEAALVLKQQHDLKFRDISRIQVETYKPAVGGHDHTEIQGIASAKLSTPFSVALALVAGKAGLDDFSQETVSDETILDLCRRVSVEADDRLTGWAPQKRAAIVRIFTVDGRSFAHEVDYPKGEPENPMTRAEVEAKFASLACGQEIPPCYARFVR